ncbi:MULTISPECIES: hypothetical protein [unclassified Pseudoalteromonas]|nr:MULTISPECIES: hypothetical protein [unclassified Pseudoalteromonas]
MTSSDEARELYVSGEKMQDIFEVYRLNRGKYITGLQGLVEVICGV